MSNLRFCHTERGYVSKVWILRLEAPWRMNRGEARRIERWESKLLAPLFLCFNVVPQFLGNLQLAIAAPCS